MRDSLDYSGGLEGCKEQELRVSFERVYRGQPRLEEDKKNIINSN